LCTPGLRPSANRNAPPLSPGVQERPHEARDQRPANIEIGISSKFARAVPIWRKRGFAVLKGFAGPKRWVLFSIVCWALGVAVGLVTLLRYSNTPGVLASPPAEWPSNVLVARSPQRSNLLLFIHPQCPCSRASLDELARIIACCRNAVQTTIFFSVPPQAPAGFQHGDLWNTASAIPTVRVRVDQEATAARRFGARTSGQALLYDTRGQLIFNGGITAFRGHSGDNDGRDAIVALLEGSHPARHTTPVFGCALF
jgi:hypothetical protein